jgi:sulfate transport system permease protein
MRDGSAVCAADGGCRLNLASLFSVNGFYGEWLAKFDIKVTYTWLGIAVAMAFTSIPFVVRTVQPVLEELGPEYEEAAETLGATRWQSFRKVVLPELSPALLAGVALSFTRSLGEFGAVIFIAGNIAWKTEVTSLMILFVCRSLIIRRRARLRR